MNQVAGAGCLPFGSAPMKLRVHGRSIEISDDYADGSLLWALRDGAGLTGTKYGCGIGICGACVVHLDGRVARACTLPAAVAGDAEITTIEGLANDETLHPVQQAFIDEQVPKCAWCMNVQIMTAVAFLRDHAESDAAQIGEALDANYCSCEC